MRDGRCSASPSIYLAEASARGPSLLRGGWILERRQCDKIPCLELVQYHMTLEREWCLLVDMYIFLCFLGRATTSTFLAVSSRTLSCTTFAVATGALSIPIFVALFS